jgi:hypothetical protein
MHAVRRLAGGLASLLIASGCSGAIFSANGNDASIPDSSTPETASPDAADATDAAEAADATDAADAGDAAEGAVDAGHEAAAEASAQDAADPCATPPTTAFYVNATTGSDTNIGAAPGCAFRTITAALAASAGHANATIHLAAGTYGAGETFPLVVDHGRSLVGAGAASTTIQGASTASYNTSGTGSFLDTGTHFVTLRAGDVMGGASNLGATTLSGFTLLPPTTITTPTTAYVGLVCIAGNAPNAGASPPLPTPSLVVQGVTVGPNFDSGVVLGSQPTQQMACNAVVTGSTVTGCNVGMVTGACGTANPVSSWPSAQVGDGQAADANTFSASTLDVFGEGCGSQQSYSGNHFTSGYRGIVIVSQSAQYFEILGNTFDGTSGPLPMGIGVHTNATAVISKLNGNTFSGISQSAGADAAAGGAGASGYAMRLGALTKQAHANRIHDNDNGISLDTAPATGFDFSADGVAANANAIYCNSKAPGGSSSGYDLVLNYAGGSAPNFQSNGWDHAPPSTSASATTSPNGTDVVTGTSAGATLTGGTAVNTACASGRSP